MRCPVCKTVADSNFCPNCGTKLRNPTAVSTPRSGEYDVYLKYYPDKVKAIKQLRADTGLSLVTAKNIIDGLFAAQPKPTTEEALHKMRERLSRCGSADSAAPLADQVVDILPCSIEDGGANVFVTYTQVFKSGRKKTLRKNVKRLDTVHAASHSAPIVSAEYLGSVYCGLLKTKGKLLFIVRWADGSADLVQATEGSKESLALLQRSQEEDAGEWDA